jgi:hypothetical protein
MAAKFRKKPVVIEAVQYLGTIDSLCEIENFLGYGPQADFTQKPPPMFIETLEGKMRADVGDWIIKGVKGEFYPCKPDIFDATYEAVNSGTVTNGT